MAITRIIGSLGLAAVALGTAGWTPVQDGSRYITPDGGWQVVRVGTECVAILYRESESEAAWGTGVDVSFHWSGKCNGEGFIAGQGVLTTEFSIETGARFRTEKRMMANAGLFEGQGEEATYSNADGPMDLHNFGDVRNPMPLTFRGGCEHYEDGSKAYDNCDAAQGAAIREEIRANGPPAFSAPASAAPAPAPAPASVPTPLPPATGANGCAATRDDSLVRFNAEFGALTQQYPTPPVSAGMRAQYQYSYFLGVEGLEILARYRPCLGPHYAANEAALKGMRDSGRDGCIAVSTTSQCAPDYPR